ncbi:MAG: type II secretion system GspH family protein [Lentisphaerales bacterium]|nr:type II secretion system GspH family protein [Lentisphaerales bacterium]
MFIPKKFTLFELLVVIAIIGILCSLLFPSLSKVRDKTKQAVCLSNQRQIGIAIISYADENGAYGPLHKDTGNNQRWHNRLTPGYLPSGPYSGTSDVQQCPSAFDISVSWESAIAINIKLCGDPNSEFLTPVPIITATPEETMMLIDSYKNWPRSRSGYMDPDKVVIGAADEIIAKHLKKANVSFLDGSAKGKSPAYLYQRNQWSHTFWDLQK